MEKSNIHTIKIEKVAKYNFWQVEKYPVRIALKNYIRAEELFPSTRHTI